jgi:hypothetical protein
MSLSAFQVASSIGLGLWPENLTREIDPPEIDQSTLVRLISGRFSASFFWYSLGCLKEKGRKNGYCCSSPSAYPWADRVKEGGVIAATRSFRFAEICQSVASSRQGSVIATAGGNLFELLRPMWTALWQ